MLQLDLSERLRPATLMAWLNLESQWGEAARKSGFGPPFIKEGPRHIVYRREDVEAWLDDNLRFPHGGVEGHHLDRRAAALLKMADAFDRSELWDTKKLANWLGVSTVWLEIGRSSGNYGPPYSKISEKVVRYPVKFLKIWLEDRADQYASRREVSR